MHKPKVILVVMDGWGYSPVHEGNAIWAAKTPNYDYFWNNYNHILLNSFGENVGLPWGSIGSSEVGHSAIGSGKLLFQELSLIDKEIVDGSFFRNKEISNFIDDARKTGDLHLIGLVSNGGVHSHVEHLYSLLKFLRNKDFKGNIYIHMITDGRDTGPKEALLFLSELGKVIKHTHLNTKIATVLGRYYAMDRDNRWDRTKKAYLAMTEGEGDIYSSPEEAIEKNYQKGVNDEFIIPSVIKLSPGSSSFFQKIFKPKNVEKNESPFGLVKPGDNIIFFNTRPDRMRQLAEIFLFNRNDIQTVPKSGLKIMTLATYNEYLPVKVAYPTKKVSNPLAKILSDHNLRQGHFAETEKYVHVTYFFNGANPKPYPGETWNLVPSAKVATYDLKPEMSAKEITDKVFRVVEKEKLDFVLINYANADMVGHTGKFRAVVAGVETVDRELGRLRQFTPESTILITADHGNAECMVHPETGEIDKHHTVNPVPFIIVNDQFKLKEKQGDDLDPTGILADIAPTVLHFLNISQPNEMNGVSLVKNNDLF